MSTTNRPIAPSAPAVQDWLAGTQEALIKRRDEILAGAARFDAAYPAGIPDEEVQGRAADFASARGIIGVFLKEADTERTREKTPYLAAGRTIDGFFKTLTEPVERVQAHIRGAMAVYATKLEAQRREEARLEAERLAAEAALAEDHAVDTMAEEDLAHAMDVAREAEAAKALAEAKAAELSKSRGELGTLVSLRTRWVPRFEQGDLMALVQAVAEGRAPLSYLDYNRTRIGIAVRNEKVREIPGLPITEERSVV